MMQFELLNGIEANLPRGLAKGSSGKAYPQKGIEFMCLRFIGVD
jgi:hypothetical protein